MKSSLGARLLYYFTGFGIGIVFVIFFFNNRGCSWTPKNRVKQSIVDRVVVLNDEFQNEMQKRGITEEMVKDVLYNGRVDFKSSQKESGELKVYNLYNDKLKLNFSLPDNSYLSEVSVGYSNTNKFSNSTEGKAKMLLFPKDDRLIYVDTLITSQPDFVKIGSPDNKTILKALEKTGEVDFEKSNYAAKPKAEHYVTCTINRQKVGLKTFWYKDRINIFFFELLNVDE